MDTAWVYLNVADPLVAWLVYRGELFSADMVEVDAQSPWTPLSIFHANRLHSDPNLSGRYATELAIEHVRAVYHPDLTSRLRGFYVFGSEADALKAAKSWDGQFRPEFLGQVEIASDSRISRYDSNWITRHFLDGPGPWIEEYLTGSICEDEPLWEYVIEGRAFVIGTELRRRAYDLVAKVWPDSLPLLEIGRIATLLGSSIGRSVATVFAVDGGLRVRYLLDMKDAENSDFLNRIGQYSADPTNPVNRKDLTPINATECFRVPDLRDREFQILPQGHSPTE